MLLIAALLLSASAFATPQTAPPSFTVQELADYRLTLTVFRQFERASRAIADVTRDDQRFVEAPLFTLDIALTGDAPVVAADLEARLVREPDLTKALRAERMTAHEYTRFALALVAARVAHGFVATGVIRRVPDGAASHNVAFIEGNQAVVEAVLVEMGVTP